MNKIIKDIMLYNSFLYSSNVSYGNLLDVGLNSHDIKTYLNEGRLIRNSYGNYSMTGEALKSLELVSCILNHTNIDELKVNSIRNCCLNSVKDDFMSISGLMLYDLEKRNFDNFLDDLRLFSSISLHKVDYYLDIWFFLSSFICDLNNEEINRIKYIVDNKKYQCKDNNSNDIISNNNFREALFRQDFYSCYEVLNSNNNILDLITCSLLKFAFLKQTSDSNQLYELIDYGIYDEAFMFLKDNESKHGLSYNDKLFYMALADLNRLINDDVLPPVNASVTNPLIGDYISSGNYSETLNLLNKATVSRSDKCLLKVLNSINSEINRVEADRCNEIKKNSDCLKHDVSSFERVIEKVLDNIDCKYKGIIYDLTLINYLDGSISIDDINDFINNLIKDCNISIDINNYILDFYRALYNNSIQYAILYLDVIDRVNSISNLGIDISLFQNDMIDYMETDNNDFYRRLSALSKGDIKLLLTDNITSLSDSDVSFLNLDDYNIKCSIIEDGEDKRLLFRHISDSSTYTMETADNYYFNGRYDEAIVAYEDILSSSLEIDPNLLVRTGLSYYANDNLERAVDYLFLADYFGDRNDFQPLISSCRNKINYNGISIDKDIGEFIKRKTYIKVKES